MDSDWQLNNAFPKVKKPCSKQSIEEENEPVEEEKDNGHSEESSLSSADETDDESLNPTQVQLNVQYNQVDTIFMLILMYTGRATIVSSL